MQSISVTFGLLNCDGGGTITASALRRHYAASTFDRIARDAAVGGGENLEALATLFEVRESDRGAFAQLAQRHFVELFPADDVDSNTMLETLDRLMREDTVLSAYASS